jgi:hypothetical protein
MQEAVIPLSFPPSCAIFIQRGNDRMPAKQKTINVVEDEQDAVEKVLGA